MAKARPPAGLKLHHEDPVLMREFHPHQQVSQWGWIQNIGVVDDREIGHAQ